jgi:hypothetical protein
MVGWIKRKDDIYIGCHIKETGTYYVDKFEFQ